MKNSENEKWSELNNLPDQELFTNFYTELMSQFSVGIKTFDELAKIINGDIIELNEMLEIKIKNTYPK